MLGKRAAVIALAFCPFLLATDSRAGESNPCETSGGGVFPEVAFFQGRLWCAVQSEQKLHVVELSEDKRVLSSKILPLLPGSLAFPRMTVEGGTLWLAYRDFETAKLRDVVKEAEQPLGAAGGNDPLAVGHGYVAWQAADKEFTIHRRKLQGGADTVVGPGRPTGLSRLLPDGRVTLIDDDRLVIPGGTRPCWAGDMVVVEGPETGNIARLGNGRRTELFAGKIAFTPKCAASGGRYAVASWGNGHVYLAVIKAGDFTAAEPPAGATAAGEPGAGGSRTAVAAQGSAAVGGTSETPEATITRIAALGESRIPDIPVSSGTPNGGPSRGPSSVFDLDAGSPRNAPVPPNLVGRGKLGPLESYCEDPYRQCAREGNEVCLFAECRDVVWMIRNTQKALSCSQKFTYHGIPAVQWESWATHEAQAVIEGCKDVCHPGHECEKFPPSMDKDKLLDALETYWTSCIPRKGISCVCDRKVGSCPQFSRFIGTGKGTMKAKVAGGKNEEEKPALCDPPEVKPVIEEVLARPGMGDALQRACRNQTDWTFPDAVVDELRKKSARWGYFCRRGNCDDPSHDVLAYYCGKGKPPEKSDFIVGIDWIVASCYDPPGDGKASIGWDPFDEHPEGVPGWTSRGRF